MAELIKTPNYGFTKWGDNPVDPADVDNNFDLVDKVLDSFNAKSTYDCEAYYADDAFTLTSPSIPQEFPSKFTIRFTAPADYKQGDKIRIGEVEIAIVTASAPIEPAPDGLFAESALVSFNIDLMERKAYPSFGGAEGDTSIVPTFSYTGNYERFNSTHPTTGSPRFYAALLTSGTLVFDRDVEVDVFLVNGGNGGGKAVAVGAKGGDGGKFSNYYGHKISKGIELAALIGAGGVSGANVGGETSLGTLIATEIGGGGGGGGAYGETAKGGNGIAGKASLARAFGGTVAPFISLRFSGGGGGGGGGTVTGGLVSDGGIGIDESGNGGHGSTYGANGYNATDNTGSGGGGAGGGSAGSAQKDGGKGGSGIILIRWGDWTA